MGWTFEGDQPIYAQLVYQIERKIVSGIYAPGVQLPTVRAFAAETGVNPNTIQRALAELEQIGLIQTQSTSGKFVTLDADIIHDIRQMLAEEQIRKFLFVMTNMGYTATEAADLINQYTGKDDEEDEPTGMC